MIIAYSSLFISGFLPYTLGTGCTYSAMRRCPAVPIHLYITDERVILLYRKSQTLLTFPNLDEITIIADEYMIAYREASSLHGK